ncbi:MAG: dihydrofolate reductase family protein [Acidimicrobiales bacterium]
MGRVVVTEFVSLDGVMEEPRWTFEFDRGPEGNQFKYEELFAAGALLLGRRTYEGFAANWPQMDGDEFGQRMNAIDKYVVSSTLADEEATWGPTTVLRGDAVAEVRELKAQMTGDLLVEGSGQLVRTLAAHGLVDEFRLMVFPVILGAGARAYATDLANPMTLEVTSCAVVGSGVIRLTLRPAPAPLAGATGPGQAA